jgi:hypothetical protein
MIAVPDFRRENRDLSDRVEAQLRQQRGHADTVTAVRVHQGSISNTNDPLAEVKSQLWKEISQLDNAAKGLASLRGDPYGYVFATSALQLNERWTHT